jgi:hypothetical protein
MRRSHEQVADEEGADEESRLPSSRARCGHTCSPMRRIASSSAFAFMSTSDSADGAGICDGGGGAVGGVSSPLCVRCVPGALCVRCVPGARCVPCARCVP